jgi:hypothetical protein
MRSARKSAKKDRLFFLKETRTKVNFMNNPKKNELGQDALGSMNESTRLVSAKSNATLETKEQEMENLDPHLRNRCARLQNLFSPHHKKILFPTAVESVIGLSCASITTYYAHDDSARYFPATFAISALLMNSLIRIAFKEDSETLRRILFCSVLYGVSDYFNRGILWHETGHAWALQYLFKNVDTAIYITVGGGFTEGYVNDGTRIPKLSELGQHFDLQTTQAMVSAAGAANELLWGCVCLIVAQLMSDNYQQLKCYIRFTAFFSILSPVIYALSSLFTCEIPSDFCTLRDKHGIDPIIAASMILGIALLTQTMLSSCTRLKKYSTSRFFHNSNNTSLLLNDETTKTSEINDKKGRRI